MKKLLVVPNLCVGCRECELMCSLKHHGAFNPARARIRVEYDEGEGCYSPVVCRHCEEPACAEACPSGAMSQDEQTGVVRIDEDLCTLCLECVEACPYGAVNVAPDGAVLKCDLCDGGPACVRFCSKRPDSHASSAPNPEGATALVFAEEERGVSQVS